MEEYSTSLLEELSLAYAKCSSTVGNIEELLEGRSEPRGSDADEAVLLVKLGAATSHDTADESGRGIILSAITGNDEQDVQPTAFECAQRAFFSRRQPSLRRCQVPLPQVTMHDGRLDEGLQPASMRLTPITTTTTSSSSASLSAPQLCIDLSRLQVGNEPAAPANPPPALPSLLRSSSSSNRRISFASPSAAGSGGAAPAPQTTTAATPGAALLARSSSLKRLDLGGGAPTQSGNSSGGGAGGSDTLLQLSGGGSSWSVGGASEVTWMTLGPAAPQAASPTRRARQSLFRRSNSGAAPGLSASSSSASSMAGPSADSGGGSNGGGRSNLAAGVALVPTQHAPLLRRLGRGLSMQGRRSGAGAERLAAPHGADSSRSTSTSGAAGGAGAVAGGRSCGAGPTVDDLLLQLQPPSSPTPQPPLAPLSAWPSPRRSFQGLMPPGRSNSSRMSSERLPT